MQIWRMKADGSQQEQLTFDEYNNWFPHVSPDGKQIVFLSFLPEVKADDHPFYKHVYIRLMPVEWRNDHGSLLICMADRVRSTFPAGHLTAKE